MSFVTDWNYNFRKNKLKKNSNIFTDEIVAIVDKLLEYKCISAIQHKVLLTKCLN